MTEVTLIQAQPRFASTGALTDVRLAGGGTYAYMQLGFGDWRSGIATPPRFSALIGFDREGPTGGALPQTGGFRFSSSDRAFFSALGNVIWDGARVIVSSGDDEAVAPTYRQRLIGTVASIKTEGAAIEFTVADLSLDLDKPVCPNTFSGTGGLEGGDEATGRIKRRTYGRVFNVEGRLLDKANSIYEFGDPAFPLASFDMVKDKGVAGPIAVVQWQGSAADTLAALRTAVPPTSGAAVAPSIACAKWFTTPAGPLTADLTGTARFKDLRPAALAHTIVTEGAASIGLPDATTALEWVPYDAGIHCDAAGETFGNLLDRLLLPVFIAWVLDGAGVLHLRRITWEGTVGQIAAETISREEVLPAIKGRKLGFQKNHRLHGDGEISTTLLLASDATYADGTPIEALKPAEAGANITENRTANAILGQGDLATLDKLDRTGGFLTGFGDLSGLQNLYFGSPYLLEQPGGVAASLAAFKTAAGYAAGFAGQGLLATLNSLANGSQFLTGFGVLSAQDAIRDGQLFGDLATRLAPWANDARFLKAGQMVFAEGVTVQGLKPGEAGANITENRNSLGFQGQGALATLAFVQFGASRTVVTADGTTVTDALAVTYLGYSAGFQGQGQLSTKDQTGYYDIKLAELTDDSAATMDNPDVAYQAPANPNGAYPVPGLSGALDVKPNGLFYGIISGANTNTGGYPDGAYTSLQFLAGGSVFLDLKIPRTGGQNGDLTSYVLLAANPRAAVEQITWRVVVRSATNPVGNVLDRSSVQRMTVQTFWKAI